MKIYRLLLLISFISVFHYTKSQTQITQDFPVSVTDAIPKDYAILSYTYGNLNRDTLKDLIIVLRCTRNEETSGTISIMARPLMVFIGQNDHTFKLVKRCDFAVVPMGYGIEYQRVVVKNGFFSIELRSGYEWWNTRVITFKFNQGQNDWFLFKDGGERFNCYRAQIERRRDLTVKDFGVISLEKYKWYEFNIEKYDPSTIQPIAGFNDYQR